MIAGIGIDAIDIARFNRLKKLNQKTLLRIFAPNELTYAFGQPVYTEQRLAARFAAKEAFYKAFCQASSNVHVPFTAVCRNCWIKHKENGAPELIIDWHMFFPKGAPLFTAHISLTHTKSTATAIVILEKR